MAGNWTPSPLPSWLILRDRICEYEKEKNRKERQRERGREVRRGSKEEREETVKRVEGEREKGDDSEEGALEAGETVGEESAARGGEMMVEVALGWRERPRHHDLGG